jgi:hypothetical protein
MRVKHRIQLLLVILLLSSFTFLRKQTNEEYSVKAAFVYKFTNYIEWDNGIRGDDFVVCVLGQSPITGALNAVAAKATVKGKRMVVKQCQTTDEIGTCQVLFISQRATQPLSEILNKLPKEGVLTISEKDGYASAGAALNFIVVDNRLRFEANPKAIYSSRLTVSSQLLKLAILVN